MIEDLRRIREPGIFIVDDVAFIHENHGMELGEAVARAGIRKQYYLETRGDVLLRAMDGGRDDVRRTFAAKLLTLRLR